MCVTIVCRRITVCFGNGIIALGILTNTPLLQTLRNFVKCIVMILWFKESSLCLFWKLIILYVSYLRRTGELDKPGSVVEKSRKSILLWDNSFERIITLENFSATNILKTFYGHLKIFIAEKFSRIKKKEFSKFYDGWARCFISILKIIRFRLKRELISWLHWTYISFGVFCLFYSIKQQAYEIPRPVYYLLRKGFRQFCLVHIPFPNDGGNPAVINVPVYETEQEKPSESISKENNSDKYHSFLWTWSKGDQTVHI